MRTIEEVLQRLRAEFLGTPGLRLKSEQVQRLCGVEETISQMMLEVLVGEGFLSVTLDGYYAHLTTDHHPHPAKADFRADRRAKEAS
jgi:hypothetical protein